jgi:small-conductance mechanosensitive channel
MEADFTAVAEQVARLWRLAQISFGNLLLPSRLWQVAIIFGVTLLAWALARFAAPSLRGWMRALEGRPKWQLRILIVLYRRLGLIFFVGLMWVATGLMRSYTVFPTRSHLLALVATIAAAWLAVSLAGQLVRNRLLRRAVTWALWVAVTVHFLDLTGEVAAFLESMSITFGDFRLSALTVLKALLVTALLVAGARMVTRGISGRVAANEDLSPSMRVLVVKFLQILLYGGAFVIGLRAAGFDLTGLALFSGAIGVGLGFGLQKVVSNLVSGIIILLDKSIKPGDVISLGDTFGSIDALGARYVSVVTRDGKEYLIPNEDLITTQVVNWSHTNEFVRLDINFGTSYADDPHMVRRVAVEAAKSVSRVLTFRAPVCHLTGFGDSSLDYVLRFWIRDPGEGLTNVRGLVLLALWDSFKANGISIPFPQREVRLLGGGDASAARPGVPED